MVELILQHLKKARPDLIPEGGERIDSVRSARTSAANKRSLLDHILDTAGPKLILSVGQGVSNVGYDPIWRAALRSASPADVFGKWQRFERFGHSKNRLRIVDTHNNAAMFQRYARGDTSPTMAENLLICGLMIALLEMNGCKGLFCDMPLGDGTEHRLRSGGQFNVPEGSEPLETTTWTIGWHSFTARTKNHEPEPDRLTNAIMQSVEPAGCKAVQGIVHLLTFDASRQWKVGDLACEAGLSTRSLQRRLGEANLSFSQLVRLVRVHEACRLLSESQAPVTSVGFCAGFSDSAHFSRDFRASMGMSPTDYRAVHDAGRDAQLMSRPG